MTLPCQCGLISRRPGRLSGICGYSADGDTSSPSVFLDLGPNRLPSAAGDRLPRFQLDSAHEPYEVVLAVNRILQAEADPWGAASWWLRANGWLDAVPAELVGTRSSDRLTAAALAEWEDD